MRLRFLDCNPLPWMVAKDLPPTFIQAPPDELLCRGKCLDVDRPTYNGLLFPRAEMLGPTLDHLSSNPWPLPAYRSIVGAPIHTCSEHPLSENSKGVVLDSRLEGDGLWCTFSVDRAAYPDIARGLSEGWYFISADVMVESSECSICGNVVHRESQWCDHLREHKGKIVDGQRAFEICRGLRVIRLIIVGGGAFAGCDIDLKDHTVEVMG